MKIIIIAMAILLVGCSNPTSELDKRMPGASVLISCSTEEGLCFLIWSECSTPENWTEYEIHMSRFPGISEWQVPENTYLLSTYGIEDTTVCLSPGITKPGIVYYFAIQTIGEAGTAWSNEIWWAWLGSVVE